MSEYYAVRRDGQDDHLEHFFGFGSKKGSERKNHKYVARVKEGDSYRYFYSHAEYAAYLAGSAAKGAAGAAKSAAGAVGGAAKSAAGAVGGAAKSAGKAVSGAANDAYESVLNATNAKVREAGKNYKDAKAMYEAAKGVNKDVLENELKNYAPEDRLIDYKKMGRNSGRAFTKMQLAQDKYKKAVAEASPKAVIKKKVSGVIDKITGNDKKKEFASDAKRAGVFLERHASLSKAMTDEKEKNGMSKRYHDLAEKRYKSRDIYNDYFQKYSKANPGKFHTAVYDAIDSLRKKRNYIIKRRK